MRLAVHASALRELFLGGCDSLTTSAVLSSRISITPDVLQQYQAQLATNGTFLAWFSATSAAGRFMLHFPQQAPGVVQAADASCDNYASVAYFSGSTLAAEVTHLPANAPPVLANIGVDLLPVRARINGTLYGDNPFFSISTRAGGNQDFLVLNRFVLPEERVVVYDKYVNASTLELLVHLAALLNAGTQLVVLHAGHTGRHLLDSTTIQNAMAAANPNIQAICKTASPAFLAMAHDRYIFLGDRVQIVFSAGLDSFGGINATTGRRSNRQSLISFFNVCAGEPLAIEAADGSVYRVNHIADLA